MEVNLSCPKSSVSTLSNGGTEIVVAGSNATLEPSQLSQLIVDMAASAIRAHRQSQRTLLDRIETEAALLNRRPLYLSVLCFGV
jgi:hypothetical protein